MRVTVPDAFSAYSAMSVLAMLKPSSPGSKSAAKGTAAPVVER